jgi:hypothetical protein
LAKRAELFTALDRIRSAESKICRRRGPANRPYLACVLAIEVVYASGELGRVAIKSIPEVYGPELDTMAAFVPSCDIFILEDNGMQELRIGTRISEHWVRAKA